MGEEGVGKRGRFAGSFRVLEYFQATVSSVHSGEEEVQAV